RLGDPDCLQLTIDVGHLRCNEDEAPEACIHAAAGSLAHVQIEDMRRGAHEHLELGQGEVELPQALAALLALDYRGLVSVELPRHRHAAPPVAQRPLAALRAALEIAQPHPSYSPREELT